MFSPFASTLTASATLTAFLAAAALPCYADDAQPPAGASGSMVFQGPVQVIPAPQGPPPGYQGAPLGSPQGSLQAAPPVYPQGYPQGYGPYPGYAPAPYQVAPSPFGVLRERTPIRYESQPRTGLIIAGAITFGSSYLMTAGITGYINAIDCSPGNSCHGTYWPLYIPVVGPFMYLGAGDKTVAIIMSPIFVISGLAQMGGLAMLIAGAVARKKVPVYAEDAGRISFAPYVSPTNAGLQAMGSF